MWAPESGVRYLLVLPAVRDEEVVPHLHAKVQPGQSVTHPHPYRSRVAGHCCHGSHFLFIFLNLLPAVPSSTLQEGKQQGSEKSWRERRTREDEKGQKETSQWGLRPLHLIQLKKAPKEASGVQVNEFTHERDSLDLSDLASGEWVQTIHILLVEDSKFAPKRPPQFSTDDAQNANVGTCLFAARRRNLKERLF